MLLMTETDSEFLEMIQFTKHKITPNDAKMTQNDKKKDQKYLLSLPGFEPTAFFPPRV